MKRLLLDMDPGVDDALAILMAVQHPDVRVEAITICAGNVGLRRCGLNALKTLAVLGKEREVPVTLGAGRPLRRSPFRARGVHGQDGLGDNRFPEVVSAGVASRGAAAVIVETMHRHPGEVHLVTTGPMTNLAEALAIDPGVAQAAAAVTCMGGAYKRPGNVTPCAEFNIFCDPDAAGEVFEADWGGDPDPKLAAVGLDVTRRCRLPRAELEALADEVGGDYGEFLRQITAPYMAFSRDAEGFDGCYLHDPLAVAVSLDPGLVTCEEFRVEVVTVDCPAYGMTVVDYRERRDVERGPKVRVATDVDVDRFMALFRECLGRATADTRTGEPR